MMTEAERKKRLEKALAFHGATHRLADVVEDLKAGRAQWWCHDDGMIITEIQQFPLRNVIHYFLVAGNLADCLALQREVDAFGREQGCDYATASGRRGWLRAAASSGWVLQHYNYCKPLRVLS